MQKRPTPRKSAVRGFLPARLRVPTVIIGHSQHGCIWPCIAVNQALIMQRTSETRKLNPISGLILLHK